MKKIALAFALLLLLFSGNAFAAPDLAIPIGSRYLNVDYFAGPANAANIAYFIVDFGASGGATHAFGYRWDGNQTAADALLGANGLTSAGPLQISATDFGGNSGQFISSMSDAPDSAAPTGNDFWDYWLGTDTASSVAWAEATDFGISGIDLGGTVHYMQNGGFYGFRVDTFDSTTFQTIGGPPVVPVAAVPEPTSVVLVFCALIGCVCMQRKVRTKCRVQCAADSVLASHVL
ncbi:MAG TPA: hypothetical protein VGI75_10920 [Pirellulales bacterium]